MILYIAFIGIDGQFKGKALIYFIQKIKLKDHKIELDGNVDD